MDYILNFQQVDRDLSARVGGKNASLGEMIKTGIRVPPGFAVTTDELPQLHHGRRGSGKILKRALHDLTPMNAGPAGCQRRVRKLMDGPPCRMDAKAAIQDDYDRLCRKVRRGSTSRGGALQRHGRRPSDGQLCGPAGHLSLGPGDRGDHPAGQKMLGKPVHAPGHQLQDQEPFSPRQGTHQRRGPEDGQLQGRRGDVHAQPDQWRPVQGGHRRELGPGGDRGCGFCEPRQICGGQGPHGDQRKDHFDQTHRMRLRP